MKSWEMLKVMEDENTPIGTEFEYDIKNGKFRAVKEEWVSSYVISFYRGDKEINESDAFMSYKSNWIQVEKVKKVTVKQIEELFGCKVEIVE